MSVQFGPVLFIACNLLKISIAHSIAKVGCSMLQWLTTSYCAGHTGGVWICNFSQSFLVPVVHLKSLQSLSDVLIDAVGVVSYASLWSCHQVCTHELWLKTTLGAYHTIPRSSLITILGSRKANLCIDDVRVLDSCSSTLATIIHSYARLLVRSILWCRTGKFFIRLVFLLTNIIVLVTAHRCLCVLSYVVDLLRTIICSFVRIGGLFYFTIVEGLRHYGVACCCKRFHPVPTNLDLLFLQHNGSIILYIVLFLLNWASCLWHQDY